MKTIHSIRANTQIMLLAAFICAPALAMASGQATSIAVRPSHVTRALPAALRPVLYRALARDANAAYQINSNGCAVLPEQALKACFDSNGAHFNGAGSPLALHLTDYGRGAKRTSVTSVLPEIKGNRVRYPHDNLTEWWRVLPVGFEQGFTLAKRPSGHGELKFALTASRQDAGAPLIRHSRESGNRVENNSYWMPVSTGITGKGARQNSDSNTLAWGKLRYGKLVVTDAKGKVVPATMKSEGDRILIAVNDARAVYPLTVDPLVWLEQKVAANDGAADDFFGWAVALSGTTALIGTRGATVNGNVGQGAAYIFTESSGTWNEAQKLTASDGAAGDGFGISVALSGATALVGAIMATVNGNSGQGAAYVFTESGGTWTQATKLTASDGAVDDYFGFSVAISDSTALIGAYATNSFQGSAYVFTNTDGTWSQTQKLIASDGASGSFFGCSVSLSGDTALVGAFGTAFNGNTYQGSAYVFTNADDTWTQTQELTASGGAAFDEFGQSVALSGNTALIGAFGTNNLQGAAYIFDEADGSWIQTAKLIASDGLAQEDFSYSVALAGNTALIGAFGVDDLQGAAYVFTESGGDWTQTQKLTASDGAENNLFGWSVALSATTALVGAYAVTINNNDVQGAAYFYGAGDLGLNVSAPQTVGQGQQYVSQTIATNNASAVSPAVTATVTVPAAASFVSATASQGSCGEDSGVVTCDFGQISGNAGTATTNVTLKATGNVGDTIENTASVAHATPALSASAPTTITEGGACPEGYSEYDGSLEAGQHARSPIYRAPAGQENAILTGPTGFRLFGVFQNAYHGRKIYRIPGNEVHREGPAGGYTWVVKAGDTGGAYTLCVLHP